MLYTAFNRTEHVHLSYVPPTYLHTLSSLTLYDHTKLFLFNFSYIFSLPCLNLFPIFSLPFSKHSVELARPKDKERPHMHLGKEEHRIEKENKIEERE